MAWPGSAGWREKRTKSFSVFSFSSFIPKPSTHKIQTRHLILLLNTSQTTFYTFPFIPMLCNAFPLQTDFLTRVRHGVRFVASFLLQPCIVSAPSSVPNSRHFIPIKIIDEDFSFLSLNWPHWPKFCGWGRQSVKNQSFSRISSYKMKGEGCHRFHVKILIKF